MHDYEYKVLVALKGSKSLTLEQLSAMTKLSIDSVRWALDGLAKSNSVKIETVNEYATNLTEEGKSYLKEFPEEKILDSVSKNGGEKPVSELKDSIGLNWAKRNGWIVIEKGNAKLTKDGESIAKSGNYAMRDALNQLSNESAAKSVITSKRETVDALIKRGLASLKEKSLVSSISITSSGAEILLKEKADTRIGEVNREVIVNRNWKEHGFRPYDVNVPVESAQLGKKHPLRNLIDQLKDTYVALGFKEMNGPIIEPAFWAFDSLHVQQDHPARTMMDTFYLSNPKMIAADAEEMRRVKREHEKAYHEKWSMEVAQQAILRPHTTATSALYIYKMVKALSENPDAFELPIKLFTIGRNFRNENIDYKHLADFYQHDGIVIGEKLALSNLFDVLLKLYSSVGVKVRFLPSYFPFVEPGVEIRGMWKGNEMEMGGAGMIRKEIVGVSRKKLTVLAWGPGVERIMLFKDKELDSITKLYSNSIGWARKKPMV